MVMMVEGWWARASIPSFFIFFLLFFFKTKDLKLEMEEEEHGDGLVDPWI